MAGVLGPVVPLTRAPREAVACCTTVCGRRAGPSRPRPRWITDGAESDGMVTVDETFPHEVPAHWLPYFRSTAWTPRR
ncbi:hypothetical protein AB0G55_29535 [Streptomyces toyocaensis]|uniref:hypothetical protein n=1 Tax=Streptomyces toyocaensis TaxID=55952 RepID=UPI000690ECFA|nr:hypothetical protein [Streptomyces toyocaensis]